MRIAVSACLLGICCKYNGGHNRSEALLKRLKGHEVYPGCPEQLGGLPTPRTPAEIVNGVVTDRNGRDVDEAFRAGAEKALRTVLDAGAELAVLQSRSPSCGPLQVYDGTFTGTLREGEGVFARMLRENGVRVLDIEDLPENGF